MRIADKNVPEEKPRFVKGVSLIEEGADHKTWGITDTQFLQGDEWVNRIEIYGPDCALRDYVIRLLNGESK